MRKLRGAMVVSVREFVFVTVGSVVVSVLVLGVLWPWARQVRRLAVIGVAMAVGIVIWNLALNLTNATGLNVDSPILGLSAQDVGSGVFAFVATHNHFVLDLGGKVFNRTAPAIKLPAPATPRSSRPWP